MNKNPYSEIIKMMQVQGNKSGSNSTKIARVIFVKETSTKLLDIKIDIDGLIIDKENIYISENLLKGYMREVKTSSDNLNWSNKSYIKTTDTLSKGDLIVVLPLQGKQTYVILNKVVKIGE